MLDEIVPRRDLAVEEECVDVRERAEREVPGIRVVAVEAELLQLLSALELVGVLEAVAQTTPGARSPRAPDGARALP
jgi:hypothetical protein